jgi:hypothetical protein
MQLRKEIACPDIKGISASIQWLKSAKPLARLDRVMPSTTINRMLGLSGSWAGSGAWH